MRALRDRVSRRAFLRATGIAAGGAILAACQPKVVEKEKVVKETEVVKETVEVVKEVTAATPEQITLRLYHHWGGSREPLMKKACDDFTVRNPNVTVEPTLIPWERKEQ
ncbi:MAG: twin-arginine translocation signal domain-containing protein, partial [Anaerolineae bacterium]|nr:twin-arginine translocation signal domain-containing protein [Anaerolineae bacterium]